MTIASITKEPRYALARLFAPKMFTTFNVLKERDRAITEHIKRVPRPSTSFAKEHFRGCAISALEIGVERGLNSESILQTLNVRRMTLVDPYAPYLDSSGPIDPSKTEKWARRRLAKYAQCFWITKTAATARLELEGQRFDFIYIDGNHAFDSVNSDITLYYPLMNDGGIFGGHDYTPFCPGVVRAVDDFEKRECVKVVKHFPDWYLNSGGVNNEIYR